MLPPSPRQFKDIYVVFELMETDLHQVRELSVLCSCNGLLQACVHYGLVLLQALCSRVNMLLYSQA